MQSIWLEQYDYSPVQSCIDPQGGSVYRAIERQGEHAGRTVAVKLQEIHPRWDDGMIAARYERVQTLLHPNLLPCWDHRRTVAEGGNISYITAMPLVEGGAMVQYDPARWSLAQRCDLMEKVLNTVRFLHEQGTIYQNLSAEHILLTQVDDVLIPQLINYGTPTKIPLAFFKNYEYLAPEQLQPEGKVSEQTDVWALGVWLYWLWTGGGLPFGKRTTQLPNAKLKERIVSDRPLPSETMNNLPPLLQGLIRGCLQREPEERWAGVEQIQQVFSQGKRALLAAEAEAAAEASDVADLPADEPVAADRRKPIWQRRFKRKPSQPIAWWWVLLLIAAAAALGMWMNVGK